MTPIDLFDGPSWDEPAFCEAEHQPVSRLKAAVEVVAGLLLLLAISASFVVSFAVLAGGINWEMAHLLRGFRF